MIGEDTLASAAALLRVLPLAGVVAIVLIAGIVRPAIQYLQHGTFGVRLFASREPAQILRDVLLVLLFVVLIAQAAVLARGPAERAGLVADAELRYLLQGLGAAVMIGGIGVFAVAQLQLGASWRIGIDEEARPGVVSRGLYRACRHPIYAGLLIALAGYALLVPTLTSFVALVGAGWGFRAQALAEEVYLLRTYGEVYRDYGREVGRFLPWFGRL